MKLLKTRFNIDGKRKTLRNTDAKYIHLGTKTHLRVNNYFRLLQLSPCVKTVPKIGNVYGRQINPSEGVNLVRNDVIIDSDLNPVLLKIKEKNQYVFYIRKDFFGSFKKSTAYTTLISLHSNNIKIVVKDNLNVAIKDFKLPNTLQERDNLIVDLTTKYNNEFRQ